MIVFIITLIISYLNYNQYSAVADLHASQSTVAHTLGFPVFTSRLLATDLNTESSTLIMMSSCSFVFSQSGN
jgi:hypothetical protein